MRKVYIRADGNSEIGLGHVIRSCALAEMLNTVFECTFFIRQPSEYLKQEIKKAGCNLVELSIASSFEEEAERWLITLTGEEIIVLDGYFFTTSYQQIIKRSGCRLVCIDDIHSYHFLADIVINHGVIEPTLYSKEQNTQLLLGPQYCLLRKPFLKSQPNKDEARNKNVILNFGGADKFNLTTAYLKKILQYSSIHEIHVVVGSAFGHLDSLLAEVKRSDSDRVLLHRNVTADVLANIISQVTLAIVPASTIALECASLGVGVISGYYVNNQLEIDSMLVNLGMSFSIGDYTNVLSTKLYNLLDKALLESNYEGMLKNQKMYFDQNSPLRLLAAFEKLAN